MTALLWRSLRRSFAVGSSLTVMLGLAGCALDTVQSDLEATTRLAAVEQPPAEELATPAKPKQNFAAAKKQSSQSSAAKEPSLRQGVGQDETSCTRVEDCASVLKAMVASPDRAWVHRPAAPAVLANGVRLFAYRALIPKLACGELAMALTEVETAAHTFSHRVAGLQPEQIRRAKTLSVWVGDELRAERALRCATQAKESPFGSVPPPPPQG